MTQVYPDYRKVDRAVATILNDFAIAEPPVNPVQIARELGVRVVFVGLDNSASGISGFYDCDENTIFVNKEEFPLRQTFTVAHELGHKIMHDDWAKSTEYRVLLRDSASQYNDFREKEANAFAAGLLMPRHMVEKYWRQLTVEQMSRLFAVSVPVVKNRLSFLYGV